jgi:hypothetical protein
VDEWGLRSLAWRIPPASDRGPAGVVNRPGATGAVALAPGPAPPPVRPTGTGQDWQGFIGLSPGKAARPFFLTRVNRGDT